MKIKAIQTRKLIPPQDDLFSVIKESVDEIPEKSVLAVSSKVVSIWRGRCLSKGEVSKKELIKRESDYFYESGHRVVTITNNSIVLSAGIDESNADGYYILPLKEPQKNAEEIKEWLKENYALKEVGVLIVDSIGLPLRRGSVGIAIGFAGFAPLRDYRQKSGLFGQKIKFSQLNIADTLASSATLVMGEGSESTPLAVIEEAPVEFIEGTYKPKDKYSEFAVPPEEDKYDIFNKLPWQKNPNT